MLRAPHRGGRTRRLPSRQSDGRTDDEMEGTRLLHLSIYLLSPTSHRATRRTDQSIDRSIFPRGPRARFGELGGAPHHGIWRLFLATILSRFARFSPVRAVLTSSGPSSSSSSSSSSFLPRLLPHSVSQLSSRSLLLLPQFCLSLPEQNRPRSDCRQLSPRLVYDQGRLGRAAACCLNQHPSALPPPCPAKVSLSQRNIWAQRSKL